MAISDRDKKLVILLLIAAILGGSYWGFTKLSEKNKQYEADVRAYSIKYSDLVNKNANKKTYEADIVENTAAFNKVLSDFNTSLSQEQTLVFLSAVEKNTGVWLMQQSLESVSQVYQFGRITSTNPAKSGQRVYVTDNVGISTKTNVSYECSYDQLKDVLTYLRENGKKVTINSMSYTYAPALDKVTGTMSLSLYAIQGSERAPQEVDLREVFVGTDNIFSSSTFTGSNAETSYKDKIIAAYDMYVIVNRTGADRDAVICGQAADVGNQTVISSNTGATENVVIKVTGREGDYKISYQIGNKLYPAENTEAGAPFICGDSIELLVISSERGTSTDTSEIYLSIINETDIAVNAAILNDDPEESRITLDQITGAVTFYQ